MEWQMPLDKRHWTTPQQHEWLSAHFPSYLEAQSASRYDKFWPTFFQEWFDEFPAPEPPSDKPTNSEHKSDSDSEQTDGELRPASSKQKHSGTNSKPKKWVHRTATDTSIFNDSYFSAAGA